LHFSHSHHVTCLKKKKHTHTHTPNRNCKCLPCVLVLVKVGPTPETKNMKWIKTKKKLNYARTDNLGYNIQEKTCRALSLTLTYVHSHIPHCSHRHKQNWTNNKTSNWTQKNLLPFSQLT
jgi:hypothetical protein